LQQSISRVETTRSEEGKEKKYTTKTKEKNKKKESQGLIA
jgi:hypothetical protein